MKLSNNLTLSEVTKSQTAVRLGINNDPTPEHLENLIALAENIFEPIRNFFNKPVCVSSGYRSKELNEATPGASLSSQHCKGEAFDIDGDITGIDNRMIFDFVRAELDFDQMIWEFGNDSTPAWVHISYKATGNRKQILHAYKDKTNKTCYKTFNLY